MICDLAYTQRDDGRYDAKCRVCGRAVVTKTTRAVAACWGAEKRLTPKELVAMVVPPQTTAAASVGPGTELKNLLKDWLGIEAEAGCGCNDMAARMDALGPDWCEGPGLTEIVKTMQGEHAKRWADGRTRLPWSDLAARQLVKLACLRARAAATNGSTETG